MAEPDESKARMWARKLAPYQSPSLGRSVLQLVTTASLFAGVWLLMLRSLEGPYWVTLLLALPAAGLLVRLFIIQHDCGHGAFLRSRTASTAIGSAIGVLTLTPYHYWKGEHAIHHATSGNLDKRGHGDIETLTLDEYLALSPWRRILYRLYRHPVVLFLVGPVFQFALKQRFPFWPRSRTRAGTVSVLTTNVALAGVLVLAWATIGLRRLLLVQVPITLIASSAGVWLFYVQHQFPGTYWRRRGEWDFHDAALEGCSHYDLGAVLQWFTGNIGLHHIHHLNSRIPNYRLQRCLDENPELRQATRLTLLGSLACIGLALWDEGSRRLVRFPGRPVPA